MREARKLKKKKKEAMEEVALDPFKFQDVNVQVLQGHESEVFVCAVCVFGELSLDNPFCSGIQSFPSWLLGTITFSTIQLTFPRSADGTARIWTIPDDPSQETKSIVLNHSAVDGGAAAESRDVTTLEWSVCYFHDLFTL